MPFDRGANGGVSGDVTVSGQPLFDLSVTFWEETFGTTPVSIAGRGDTDAWVPTFPLTPGGNVILMGKAQMRQAPTPQNFSGGVVVSLALTFHILEGTAAKQTVQVRIDTFKASLAKDPKDGWDVTLVGAIVATPSYSGFGQDAPVGTVPAPGTKEVFSGLSKSEDPKRLQSAGTRRFFVAPLTNTDAAETNTIAALIAAAVSPISYGTGKLRSVQLEAGRTYNSAFFLLSFGLTDTEEDVVNPATQTTVDPNKLESQAQSAGVHSAPIAPGGDFVEQTTTTQEINDGATQTTKAYGLLDTKEKVEFPGTVADDDLYSLVDDATIRRVHDSATVPADPAVPLGQLLSRETVQLNRYRWQTTWKYGNTNSKQKIEFPDAGPDTDPATLNDRDVQKQVTSSSTPPSTPAPNIADLQLVRLKSERVGGTPEQWLHQWSFARNTSEDEVEIQGANQTDDPDDLGESAIIRRVTNSATPPSPPSAPVGVLLKTTTEPLTVANGTYTGRWVHTFDYGPTTKKQSIEFDGNIVLDPVGIDDGQVIPIVNGSSTPPGTPTPEDDYLKLRKRTSKRLQGTPERWVHVFEFARNTTEDDREHTRRNIDADDFEEVERIPVLHTSPTSAPSTPSQAGTVSNLVDVTVERITVASGLYTGLWLWTFVFSPNTRKQEIEQQGSDLSVDPAVLDDDDAQTLTNNSSTPPSTPSARVSGQVLLRRESKRLQHTPERWRHRFIFGYRTSAGKLVADRTRTEIDTGGLRSNAVTAEVWLVSGGAPSAPTLVGFKLRSYDDIETNNPAYRLRVYTWGLTTTDEDVENANTWFDVDPSGLQSSVRVASFSGTPPLPVGYAARSEKTQEHNDGKTLTTVEGGLRTTAEDRTFDGSTTVDPSGLEDKLVVITIDTTATAPGTAVSGYQRRSSITKQLTSAGTPKYEHTEIYGRTTTEEDIEYRGTTKTTSADKLADRWVITQVTTSDTPSAPGATINSVALVLRKTESQQLTTSAGSYTNRWAHTFTYERNTETTEIQNRGSVAIWTPEDGAGRVLSTVSADTSTSLADLLTTAIAANKSTASVGKVEVRRLDNASIETVVQHLSTKQGWRFFGAESYREPRDVLLGTGGPGIGSIPAVWVADQVNVGGFYMTLVTPNVVWGARGKFSITSRINTSTINLYWSLRNTVNASTWYGFPPETITFIGADYPDANNEIATDAPRTITRVLTFAYDTNGFVDEQGVISGTYFEHPFPLTRGFWATSVFLWGTRKLTPTDYNVPFAFPTVA